MAWYITDRAPCYGDLPVFEDLPPEDAAGLARALGSKYRRNWTSAQLGIGGLWNNYAFPQTQLPDTWSEEGRAQWGEAALALYEDYQLPAAGVGAQRLDVDPLKILVIDMRCHSDEDFTSLVPRDTLRKIAEWADDLIRAKHDGQPALAVLSEEHPIEDNANDAIEKE